MKIHPFSLLLLFALCSSPFALAASPRNVLFIAVDDMNDWVEPFGGNSQALTPHLARFADSGAVVFQNAHCAGPVCGPSRSALLSGFMPHRSGVYGNSQNMLLAPLVQKHATLPEYFSKNGYVAMSMGKIFHRHGTAKGSDSGQWAFDVWEKTRGGSPVDKNRVTSRNRNLIEGKPGPPSEHLGSGGSEFAWGPTVGGKEETRDYQTAQWAAEKLMGEHEKPFFLAIGLSRPHLPFYAPQEFFDLYDREKTQAPEIREDDLDDILTPGGKPKFRASDDYLWLKENGLMREASRAYLAATSYADACLGVIFDALEKSPHAENTIVFFWGDHGWHLGEKLRFRKATGWSESTRVPLMVRLPGMTKRQDCPRLVNLIDLYPTLIDLCGLPAKPEIDGRSFARRYLENPEREWDFPALTITGEGSASIRDERWRFIRYREGTEELYDLHADPMEFTNLAASKMPEAEASRERLMALMPKSFAKGVPVQSAAEKERFKKQAGRMDETIKRGRSLERLK